MDGAEDHVGAVRAFNRFYTRVIGLLGEGLLDTPYSLTEARVIFELGRRGRTEVGELRDGLRIDRGYLSRMLARFEAAGLVARRRSSSDGRRQVVRLTAKGRRAFEGLDTRSSERIGALLDRLDEAGRSRLVRAMRDIRGVLEEPARDRSVLLRALGPGDFGWVISRHGAVYAQEYGWDSDFEALVARIVADYIDRRDSKREAAWMAELDGAPAGCVFCTRREDTVAQLRLLLVESSARGVGIGTRLVGECIEFARRAGYVRMMLWTNDVLVDARRIYERFGFELKEQERHHSFGHDLVRQNWWLDLST